MPIKIDADIHHLDQNEFGPIAYGVMEHIFEVHNKMGRFLDEDIYRDAVATRIGRDSQTEVLIEVMFDDFCKEYYIDLLVAGGAVFELKTVRRLGVAHRSQLLIYLLLCELSHGKLVNLRPEKVEHEFVNTTLKRSDQTVFQVVDQVWNDPCPAGRPLTVSPAHESSSLPLDQYHKRIGHISNNHEVMTKRLLTEKLKMSLYSHMPHSSITEYYKLPCLESQNVGWMQMIEGGLNLRHGLASPTGAV